MPKERTAEIFNMTPFLEAEELPVDPNTGNPLIQRAIKRQGSDIWRVRAEPLAEQADGPLAWTLVREGDLVRIPLLPYRSKQEPVWAMLAGMDVIQRYLESVPTAKRTHIILGDPIEEVDGEFRFWLGFAAHIQ